jgi:hypothetical protein
MLRLPSTFTKKCECVAKGAGLPATLGGCIVRRSLRYPSRIKRRHNRFSIYDAELFAACELAD